PSRHGAVGKIEWVILEELYGASPFAAHRPERIKNLIMVKNSVDVSGWIQCDRIIVEHNHRVVREGCERTPASQSPDEPLRLSQAHVLQQRRQRQRFNVLQP